MNDNSLNKKSFENSEFKANVRTAGADDFVFLYNLDTDVISLSDEVVQVLNLPSNKFNNAFNTLSSICHPEDNELFAKAIARLKTGGMGDFIAEYRFENGKELTRNNLLEAVIVFDSNVKSLKQINALRGCKNVIDRMLTEESEDTE